MRFPLLLLFSWLFAEELVIVPMPIDFTEVRTELTKEYIRLHNGIEPKDITIIPQMIVLHWTAIPTLEKSYEYFKPETLLNNRPDIINAGRVNTSAHYLVDYDGTIYQMMPENLMARHTIGLNLISIGIENVGSEKEGTNLTPAQVVANAKLIRHLVKKYPTITHLIGHYQYQQLESSRLWNESNPTYRTPKIDPGAQFLGEVIETIKPLKLTTLPL